MKLKILLKKLLTQLYLYPNIEEKYISLVQNLLLTRPNLEIVVIGANDGKINDPLFDILDNHVEKCSLHLFEPNFILHSKLEANFAHFGKKSLYEVAINDGSECTMWFVKESYWKHLQPEYAIRNKWPIYRAPTGVSSMVKSHVVEWVKKTNINIDPNEAIFSKKIQSSNLYDALSTKVQKLDILQIDTEGVDDFVLYSCSVGQFLPKVVNIEISHIGEERTTNLINFLKSLNYKTFYNSYNLVAYNA